MEKEQASAALDPALVQEPAEVALAAAIAAIGPRVAAEQDPTAALRIAAELGPPVDALFDDVMVLAEEPGLRANRVRLVRDALAAFAPVGDLTQLQR